MQNLFRSERPLTTKPSSVTDRYYVLTRAGDCRFFASATLIPFLSAVAKPDAICEPDRRGGDRLADLRPDRQRLRAWHDRAGAVPAHGIAGVCRRPDGRQVRTQARGAALPVGGGRNRSIPLLGFLCRLAHRGPYLHRDVRPGDG